MAVIRNLIVKSSKEYTQEQLDSFNLNALKSNANLYNKSVEELIEIIKEREIKIAEYAKNPTSEIDTPARRDFRQKLVSEYLERFEAEKKEKQATFVIGQIAAGKSTLVDRIAKEQGSLIVDTDYFKCGREEFDGLKEDFEKGLGHYKVHKEADGLSLKTIELATQNGSNIILPKTGTPFTRFVNYLSTFKKYDYDINLVYNDLPLENCVERNYNRFFSSLYSGGDARLVPLATIYDAIDDKPYKTFCTLLEENPETEDDANKTINDFKAFSSLVKRGDAPNEVDIETMNRKYYLDEAEKEA